MNIIIILTHDTPEGSIMCNSGPSGPWELNSTLQKSNPELHKETGMGEIWVTKQNIEFIFTDQILVSQDFCYNYY